ncbi:hypothetical protein Dimus_033252 [Dionaea muscipula]
MLFPVQESCKKRKRKPKVYAFNTFCDPGCPINPTGPFRDNIRLFIQECGEPEDYHVNEMPIWCTLLSHENKGVVVPLFTVEENVKYSNQPFCDHCRCSGWSHHYVSKRKYHVIIPVDAEWNKPLKDTALDIQTHLLHGLIHCNGFGHLVSINGIEGGSKFLCGREIMDLWDRICTNLGARKMTVEDVSKKRSMDLRLLHGIAYGHSWFGKWGYRFLHGSFGVSEHHYERAIQVLSSLKLDDILRDFSISDDHFTNISQIIRWYRDLSETCLITIRDLLRLMLTLKSGAPNSRKLTLPKSASSPIRKPPENKLSVKEKTIKSRKFEAVVATMDSRWPARRLEYAAQVIVDALKDHNNANPGGMPRQEVRDAARLHIGDTGLLDYVLKSMNNVIVGNHIVRRSINPVHRVLEYSIQELYGNGNSSAANGGETETLNHHQLPVSKPAAYHGFDVYNDLIFLYKNVLLCYPQSSMPGLAKQAILDSKRFVKEWPFKDEDDQLLRYICRILPSSSMDLDEQLSENFLPGELIVVPLYATIGELKLAAEHALRDTYCIATKYIVTGLGNMEGLNDDEVVFGAIESGSDIWTLGTGISLKSELKYEGGHENWTVMCECGAKDDDGERMVSCDVCEVWQHTRCSGIDDSSAVPPLFLCQKCCGSLVPQRAKTYGFEFEMEPETLLLPSEYGFWEGDAAFVM